MTWLCSLSSSFSAHFLFWSCFFFSSGPDTILASQVLGQGANICASSHVRFSLSRSRNKLCFVFKVPFTLCLSHLPSWLGVWVCCVCAWEIQKSTEAAEQMGCTRLPRGRRSWLDRKVHSSLLGRKLCVGWELEGSREISYGVCLNSSSRMKMPCR